MRRRRKRCPQLSRTGSSMDSEQLPSKELVEGSSPSRCIALKTANASIAQWQSRRLLTGRLWVRLPLDAWDE